MTPTTEPTKDPRTMLATPIAQLLRSRKFLLLIGAMVADMIVALVPAFEPVREQLITVISALFGALILAISHEDASKPAPGTTSSSVKVDAQTVSTPAEPPPAPFNSARPMPDEMGRRPPPHG